MYFNITGGSGFSVLDVVLEAGEVIAAQPKSMVCMSTGIEVTAKLGGVSGSGPITGSIKGLLAGENVALAYFTSTKPAQTLSLAPDVIGPILSISLEEGRDMLLAKGAYLASEPSVTLQTVFTGMKGFLSKKGLFLVRAKGPGNVFLSAAGEIREKMLEPEERFVVDNDYVVAFDSSIKYELVTASKGIANSLLSGEGLVNRYTGPGKVFYQTRAKAKQGVMGTIFNTVT